MRNVCYEPMDIDSSANSCSPMEISYSESVYDGNRSLTDLPVIDNTVKENHSNLTVPETACCQEVKKFHINLTHTRPKSKPFILSRCTVLIITSAILSLFTATIVNINCFHDLNLSSLKDSLTSNVYGQSEAIETFIQALEADHPSKILLLYGGTGVGKTLSISIFLGKLLNHTNVYHYTMPSFTDRFSSHLKLGFNFCQKVIIIVDDLNVKDKHIVPIITEIVEKSENLKKKLTLILIFNCNNIGRLSKNCNTLFLTDLRKMFVNIKAALTFIRYNSLTTDTLEKCIEIELKDNLRNVDIREIIKMFNVEQDGCKGVHTKIKALTI